MDHTTREYIRSEVNRAVSDRLTPNFFDYMFQEMRFKNLTSDAVSKYLPSEVTRQLASNTGIVATHVNAQVPLVLRQEMAGHLAQMQSQFQTKLQEQQQQVSAIQSRHLAELKTASQDLISSQVASISSNNTVLDLLRSQILLRGATFTPLYLSVVKHIHNTHPLRHRIQHNRERPIVRLGGIRREHRTQLITVLGLDDFIIELHIEILGDFQCLGMYF